MSNQTSDQFSCLICGSSKVELYFKMPQKIDDKTTQVNILKCTQCQTSFCHPRPTIEQLSRYYDNNPQDLKASIAYYKQIKTHLSYGGLQEAQHFIRNIQTFCPPPAKLLDVACGHGWHLNAAKKAGYKISGLEISQSALSIAYEALNIAAHEAEQGLFEDLIITPENTNSYDIVLMSQVLEHTLEPLTWVEKAYKLTRPGGIIAIAIPNHHSLEARVLKKKYAFFCPPEHLNYFCQKSMQQLTKQFPLKIETCFTRNYFAFSSLMDSQIKRGITYGLNMISDKILWNQGRYLYTLFRKQ